MDLLKKKKVINTIILLLQTEIVKCLESIQKFEMELKIALKK